MPHGIAIFEAYEEIPIFDSKNKPLVSFFTLQAASATLCMLAAAKACQNGFRSHVRQEILKGLSIYRSVKNVIWKPIDINSITFKYINFGT